jgi:hypothetical protein
MIHFYRVAQLMNHEIFHRKYCKTVFAFGACRNYAINRSTRLHTAPSGAELFIAHDTKTISSPVRGDLFNSSYSDDMLVLACRSTELLLLCINRPTNSPRLWRVLQFWNQLLCMNHTTLCPRIKKICFSIRSDGTSCASFMDPPFVWPL